MYRDEQIASSLAKLFDAYDYAMIDTCSMMEESFPTWLETFEKSKKYSLQFHPLIVLKQCVQELKKHSKGKILEKKRTAKLALEILKTAKKNKTIAITRYKLGKRNFGDHAIFSKVNDDHLDYKILVITQDKGLTSDILKLNEMLSINGKPVSVMKLSKNAELVRNKGIIEPSIKSKPNNPQLTSVITKKEHPLVISDRRLSAVISNPNYPKDKKINDVKSQLSSLSKTDTKIKKGLTLNYSEDKLASWLNENAPKREENRAPKAIVKVENRPIVKVEDKPAPKKESEPPMPKANTYVGEAKELKSALYEAALSYGIIIHDTGVPYLPNIHGPKDLSSKDLNAMVAAYEKGGKKPFDYKDLHFEVIFKDGRYYVTMSLNKVKTIVENPPKEERKMPAKIAPEIKPTPVKKEEPKKEEPKPVAKKVKQPKPEAKPAPVKKEKKPEVKEKPKANPKKTKQPVKAAPSKKEEASVKKEEAAKPAPKAAKETAKKAKPEVKENKPASKEKASNVKGTAKPEAPKKVSPKHPKVLEQAKLNDARLMAVIPNPTYSNENKAKDIQAQIALLSKLSKDELAQIKLGIDNLKKTLKDLSNSK